MRLWLLRWITLVGLLGFVRMANAQDTGTALPDAVAHEAMQIALWNTDSGGGSSVFWSPDSHYVVASNPLDSSDEAVKSGLHYGIYDLFSGTFLYDFPRFVDWLPDSKQIITRDSDTGNAQIREVPSGKVVMTLEGAQVGWKWSRDRTRAASESVDHQLSIYDMATGKVLQTWRNVLVQDALWNDDGRLIAVMGTDTMLRVYDVTTGSLKAQLVGYRPVAWNANDRQLIVTPIERTFPGKLGLWTLENGRTTMIDVDSLSYVWSPDGSQVAIAGTDHYVHILDTNSGNEARKIQGPSVRFSVFKWHDSQTLILISGDLAGGIPLAYEVYNLQNGSRILKAEFDILSTAWVQDDQLEIVQALCSDICRIIYDLKTGEQLSFTKFQGTRPSSLLYLSPNHQWVLDYSYSSDRGVSNQDLGLYAVESATRAAILPGYKSDVLYITWSPDSHYFAVITPDKVYIWAINA